MLVLIMTLSMAGLALSAVLLSSTSSFIQKFYDKDKDFRFAARAAIGLVKSRAQRDTLLAPDSIPSDSAYRDITASVVPDAAGGTSSTIKVNGYAAFIGDTGGTYIPFLTVMAQAYDTMGVRSVQRLDLQSESFSRYAMYIDSFPATGSPIQIGQHVHGRVHGNRNWSSTATNPGPDYYDTVTVVSTLSGTANYHGITAVTGAKRNRWLNTASPPITKLTALATAGNLSFAPVSGTSVSRCIPAPLVDLSGHNPSTVTTCIFGSFGSSGGFSFVNVPRGSRLRFRPVDVNGNGSYDANEGFFEVFDLAAGMDTGSLRADLTRTNPGSTTDIVLLNQCGLMVTIAGRKEFFPVARFREGWVQTRVQLSTSPTVTAADASTMGGSSGGNPTAAAVSKVMSYGIGYSRCFPAGSPWLMLTERYVDASCTVTTNTGVTPYGWGSSSACAASTQYGGQDTTFTASVTRCYISGSNGQCSQNQVSLGSWRLFSSGGGTSTANPPAAILQAVEKPYLWPISATYNAASRGVIAATSGPLFISDTLRGYATLYVAGATAIINDVVYDKPPTDSASLCRNFLGIISSSSMRISENALNYPRADPSGVVRYFGTPNVTLNGILMSFGSIGVEDSTYALAGGTVPCNGTNTAGGCVNLTGGIVARLYRPLNTTTIAGSGLILNQTRDPCQDQQTNRRPPFFPLTGKFVDYKSYDVDPRQTSTWATIKTYLARLRGNNRAVP